METKEEEEKPKTGHVLDRVMDYSTKEATTISLTGKRIPLGNANRVAPLTLEKEKRDEIITDWKEGHDKNGENIMETQMKLLEEAEKNLERKHQRTLQRLSNKKATKSLRKSAAKKERARTENGAISPNGLTNGAPEIDHEKTPKGANEEEIELPKDSVKTEDKQVESNLGARSKAPREIEPKLLNYETRIASVVQTIPRKENEPTAATPWDEEPHYKVPKCPPRPVPQYQLPKYVPPLKVPVPPTRRHKRRSLAIQNGSDSEARSQLAVIQRKRLESDDRDSSERGD